MARINQYAGSSWNRNADTSDDTMLLSEADDIFKKLSSSLQTADKELVALYTDMITKAIDYAGIRSEWLLLSPEEKKYNKEQRELLHDTFIVTLNTMEEAMISRKIPTIWRDQLGSDRKRIGDFACYLALFYGLNSR
ncbi:MAG: hypothetical protein LKG40_08590 [Lachnospiraceae bacterium]|jgi:hypothetical protein|nr:hypothetical protein [Lachnospiraceae bacterium]MCI1329072.1 hypothetical protein [Lachnospiraceae bacterium]